MSNDRTLEWLKYAAHEDVSQEVLLNTSVSQVEDWIYGRFVYRLKADILSERLPDRHYRVSAYVEVPVPATTWQKFKETHEWSWWLGWLVARRPVRTIRRGRPVQVHVDIEDYLLYPWQTRVLPEMGRVVRFPSIHIAVEDSDDGPL